jgi:hypothetical protein
MKESYGEGVANHTGPESCVAVREDGGEALARVRTGWVLSRERGVTPERRRYRGWRKATSVVLSSKTRQSSARSEAPSMYGNTSSGNREIPPLSGQKSDRTALGSLRTNADDAR